MGANQHSNATALELRESYPDLPAAIQEHDAAGRFASQPRDSHTQRFAALPDDAVESLKTAFIDAFGRLGTLDKAVEESGMSWGSLYRWAEHDERLQECLHESDRVRAAALERKLDDVIDNPEAYDTPLKRPTWGNLFMFRLKKLKPEYREAGLNIQVNVAQVATLGEAKQALELVRSADADERGHIPE